MKTERMVKAYRKAKLALRKWFAAMFEPYDALGVDVGRVLVVKPGTLRSDSPVTAENAMNGILHVVEVSDFAFLVSNDGESQVASRDFVNILDPSLVAFDRVRGKTDQLDPTFRELGLELCKGAELGCAYWRVVLGMREENDPIVADEFVKVDLALGGFGVKVGRNAAET